MQCMWPSRPLGWAHGAVSHSRLLWVITCLLETVGMSVWPLVTGVAQSWVLAGAGTASLMPHFPLPPCQLHAPSSTLSGFLRAPLDLGMLCTGERVCHLEVRRPVIAPGPSKPVRPAAVLPQLRCLNWDSAWNTPYMAALPQMISASPTAASLSVFLLCPQKLPPPASPLILTPSGPL